MVDKNSIPIVWGFEGQYRFLSNFWVEKDGYTNEHYFQAMKTLVTEEYTAIMEADSPGEAKRLGRKATLRSDWETVKDEAMRLTLDRKFRDPELRQKLLDTKQMLLFEANYWGDSYWGVDTATGTGKNVLGKLLMELRETIRKETENG